MVLLYPPLPAVRKKVVFGVISYRPDANAPPPPPAPAWFFNTVISTSLPPPPPPQHWKTTTVADEELHVLLTSAVLLPATVFCPHAFPITSIRIAVRHAHARVCMSVRECARAPRRAAAGLFPVISRACLSFFSFVNFSFIFVNFLFFPIWQNPSCKSTNFLNIIHIFNI